MLSTKLLAGLGLALGLLRHTCRGQGMPIPHYSPPAIPMPMAPMNLNLNNNNPYYREGAGSYQVTAGTWYRAEKMRFDGNKLVVKSEATTKLTLSELRQLEVSQDTFLILNALPGRAAAAQKPEALQVVYSYQGTRLFCLFYNYKPLYFLKRPAVSLQLLPSDKAEFKTAMLAIVQGCPELATQVASGQLGRRDAVQIIQRYDACQ